MKTLLVNTPEKRDALLASSRMEFEALKQELDAASDAAHLCVLLLRLRDTPCNGKLRQISDSGLGKAVTKRLTNHGDAEVAIIYRKSENTGKVFISE